MRPTFRLAVAATLPGLVIASSVQAQRDSSTGRPAEVAPQPIAPPAQAAALGWMPLASSNVPAFRVVHPTYDGRGVLIAVLDGGLDPVPGLTSLPGGGPKILDMRDFSGEGRIALTTATLRGDSVQVGPKVLAGAGRIRSLAVEPRVYGGVLTELPLGEPPAADVNGNGTVGDTLVVVVARATDGWVVLADSDGDGSLDGERPMHDYLTGRETFAWHTGDRPAPLSVAVNFTAGPRSGPPVLDLVFDNSGHGTHVAGIAAGSGMYRLPGFDGVAPGAALLSLKIANDARGGITRTGSIIAAMDYAVRFAAARRLPLVINLSYGVGNETEGRVRIDALVDSLLAAHPDVVMTVSAGNDGPGLSTIGFPASARRPITVGATYPGAFLPPRPDGSRLDDQVAFFSARGGEWARPDLVAPGVAYATVAPWDIGEEVKDGTSMAAPHVAGLAALLMSGLAAEGRVIRGESIRRSLMASSTSLAGASLLDQGAGQPDVLRAWSLLAEPAVGEVAVDAGGGLSGVWLLGPMADSSMARTFTLTRAGATRAVTYSLRADQPWIVAPSSVSVARTGTVPVRYRRDLLLEPGAHIGVIEGWGPDSAMGPAFRLASTIIVPTLWVGDSLRILQQIPAGGFRRLFVPVDSGRPFTVSVREPRGAPLLVFLHEPGGMPWRGGAAAIAGAGDSAAVFRLDARDVTGGVYELVTVAGPVAGVSAEIEVDRSPVGLALRREGDAVEAWALGTASPELRVEVAGAEATVPVQGKGSDDVTMGFRLPGWARKLEVELVLDRNQWPRFTDFGLTVVDGAGRQLGAEPMNYALGRLEVVLPDSAERHAAVVLSPGFAEPGRGESWSGRLVIRLYAASPVAAPLAATGTFTLPQLPWAPSPGFFPLARVTATVGTHSWTREAGLPDALTATKSP